MENPSLPAVLADYQGGKQSRSCRPRMGARREIHCFSLLLQLSRSSFLGRDKSHRQPDVYLLDWFCKDRPKTPACELRGEADDFDYR